MLYVRGGGAGERTAEWVWGCRRSDEWTGLGGVRGEVMRRERLEAGEGTVSSGG